MCCAHDEGLNHLRQTEVRPAVLWSDPMLFDDRERTDASATRDLETELDFLDRSEDPAVAEVRASIGREFATYIGSEKAELETRLRLGNRSEFLSACFELLSSLSIKT